jgi:hypothetical protein
MLVKNKNDSINNSLVQVYSTGILLFETLAGHDTMNIALSNQSPPMIHFHISSRQE